MTQISGGSAPNFRIGSSGPTNYARFSNASTPGWGSALSKLGGAWTQRHNREQAKAAKLAQASELTTKRHGWMQAIGEGATLREVAASDPSVLGDTAFIKFVHSTTAPKGFTDVQDDEGNVIGQRGPDNRWHDDPHAAPEPESWEDVQNPFGHGGFGQRSSLSNKISGYQGPAAQTPERERRTAKDRFGRLRYLDDESPAFSDKTLGPAPEAEEPPLKDRLAMVRDLSSDWRKTTAPMEGLLAQADRMDIGFKMAQNGDLLAGSQAILISFNKLLDPTSVVRESEYARSESGQSALETLRGFVDRLAKGGSGVTLAELNLPRVWRDGCREHAQKHNWPREKAHLASY